MEGQFKKKKTEIISSANGVSLRREFHFIDQWQMGGVFVETCLKIIIIFPFGEARSTEMYNYSCFSQLFQ